MTRLSVVIPAMADRHKASAGVEGECSAVIHRYFKDDAFGSAHAPFGADQIQQRRADPFAPAARQYAKRYDLAFLAEVESQGKSGRCVVHPSDSAEESGDVHYLDDRCEVPRIFGKAGAVQRRHCACHGFGQWLETTVHRMTF